MEEIRVSEVMTKNPTTIDAETPILEVARILVENKIGGLPVVKDGKLIGIVTDGDLIMQDIRLEYPSYVQFIDGVFLSPAAVSRFEDRLRKAVGAHVEDVMTTDVVTTTPTSTIEDAATLMVENRISRLPVVEGDAVVGIITKADIVRSMLKA